MLFWESFTQRGAKGSIDNRGNRMPEKERRKGGNEKAGSRMRSIDV